MKQEILSRSRNSCNHIERKLKCGHTQVEPRGSKAKDAKWAKCSHCAEAAKLLIFNKALNDALKTAPNFES